MMSSLCELFVKVFNVTFIMKKRKKNRHTAGNSVYVLTLPLKSVVLRRGNNADESSE